ncbi:hypothetical protein [Thalassobellus suaedae]|uniref:Uncharacterized protein n=1 Tax=Thalassobellus suaedae TaxID=3074124 RepID=A0ABY9XW33_9FLAO|nr:hypothetical protein RHP51_04735 [Flavobacteriaceae bacterium HL-DH14]
MSNFKIGQLYDQALAEMPKEEVQSNLEAICYEIEERSYTKNLTEEELEQRKDEYSTIGIKLSEINESKKEMMDSFKQKLKEPKLRSSELIKAIKFKSEQRYGKLFSVDDQESGMMYSFDTNGVCVDARPLTKEERQFKLKTVNQ